MHQVNVTTFPLYTLIICLLTFWRQTHRANCLSAHIDHAPNSNGMNLKMLCVNVFKYLAVHTSNVNVLTMRFARKQNVLAGVIGWLILFWDFCGRLYGLHSLVSRFFRDFSISGVVKWLLPKQQRLTLFEEN